MKKNKKLWIPITAVVLALGVIVGTVVIPKLPKEQAAVFPVSMVGYTDFYSGTTESYGMVTTDKVQTLYVSDTLTVTEILVYPGQEVKKGDVLFTYDTTLSDLAVERKDLANQQLEVQLTTAKNELAALRKMKPIVYKPGSTSTVKTDYTKSPADKGKLNTVYSTKTSGTSRLNPLYVWLSSSKQVDNAMIEYLFSEASGNPGQIYVVFQTTAGNQANKEFNSHTGVCFKRTYTYAPADPTTPTGPSQEPSTAPTGPSQEPSTEPNESTGTPSQPTEPNGSTDPTPLPSEPEASTDPAPQPSEPEESTDPAPQPSEPEESTDPAPQPSEPEESTDPTPQPPASDEGTGEDQQPESDGNTDAGQQPPESDGNTDADPQPPASDGNTDANDQPAEPNGDTESNDQPAEPNGNTNTDTQSTVPAESPDEPASEAGESESAPQAEPAGEPTPAQVRTVTYSMSFFTPPSAPKEDSGTVQWNDGYTSAELTTMRNEKQAEIKQLEFDIKMGKAELKIMQKEASDGKVTADWNGVVSEILDPATALESGEPLMKVTGGGGYYVEGTVSELALDTIQVGQNVTVNSWDTGMTYTGRIVEIGAYPSQEQNYYYGSSNVSFYPYKVYIDQSADLQEGYYVSLMIQSEEQAAGTLYLQNAFLRSEGNRTYVFVRNADGLLEKRYLECGVSTDGYMTPVYAGITEEDFVAFPYGKEIVEGAPTFEGTDQDLYGY